MGYQRETFVRKVKGGKFRIYVTNGPDRRTGASVAADAKGNPFDGGGYEDMGAGQTALNQLAAKIKRSYSKR